MKFFIIFSGFVGRPCIKKKKKKNLEPICIDLNKLRMLITRSYQKTDSKR